MKMALNVFLLVFIVIVFGYIAFLTVFPGMLEGKVNTQNLITNIFSITKMKAEFKAPTFYTTKDLNLGIKLRDVKINYADDKKYLEAAKIEIELAALPLVFKNIKVNKFEVFSPSIDLLTLSNGKLKITDYLNSNFSLELLNTLYPKAKGYKIEFNTLDLVNFNKQYADVKTGKFSNTTGKIEQYDKNAIKAFLSPYLTSKKQDKNTIILK